MPGYRQIDLRTIAGLSGIIPSWWISPARGETGGADAWLSFKSELDPSGETRDELRWFPFDNGEHYGLMPAKIWEKIGRPDHPRIFAAAGVYAPGPVEALYRFDFLCNYRLWVNGERVADRWEDDIPLLDKGQVEVRLNQGLNGIILELPLPIFKDKILFCGRISGPDETDLNGLKILASGRENATTSKDEELTRSFSAFEIFNRFVSKEPAMRFTGDGPDDFRAWKAHFKGKFLELIGDFPEPVPLDPRIVDISHREGITRERVFIQTQDGLYLPLHLLIPDKRRDGQAIVCVHGHGGRRGKYGKEQVTGEVNGDPTLQWNVWKLDYDYGLRFAREGYITITPDFRGFGERAESLPFSSHDDCAVNLMRYICYGENFLTYQIWDGIRAVDYLVSRPEVDPDRIGLTGLSYGGRMTQYIGAVDERMKVCVASGTMSTLRERKTVGRACGSQTLPGLLTYGDATEVFGLIAPRPLMMQLGTNDATAPVFFAPEIDRDLRRIYASAGDESRYSLDVYHAKHRYNFPTALKWFERWL